MKHFNINRHFDFSINRAGGSPLGIFIGSQGCGKTSQLLKISSNIHHQFTNSYLISLDERYVELSVDCGFQHIDPTRINELCTQIKNSFAVGKSTLLIIDDHYVNLKKCNELNTFIGYARHYNTTIFISVQYLQSLPIKIVCNCDLVVFFGSSVRKNSKRTYEEFFGEDFANSQLFHLSQRKICENYTSLVKVLSNSHQKSKQLFTYSLQDDDKYNAALVIIKFLKSCKFRRFKKWIRLESTIQWIYTPGQIGAIFAKRDIDKTIAPFP